MFIVASKEECRYPRRYYKDTRGLPNYSDSTDIFDSSPYVEYATKYPTKEAAEKWNAEFLFGEGEILEI